LERSVGLRAPLTEGRFRLVPIEDDPVWARVDIEDAPDIEEGLRRSDLGLATYRAGDDFIMLVQRRDGVYGRIVPVAEPLDQSLERGTAAEDASRDSASHWGLSDFVFQPETVQRGSATREVGDGTIVCGDRGLAVQVKARPISLIASAHGFRRRPRKAHGKPAAQSGLCGAIPRRT
jgi:hypothetical protein